MLRRSDVLVDEDRVSVGVHGNKTSRPRRLFICLAHQFHALRLELALKLAHVCESVKFLGVTVPARIESQDVLFEHPLEKTDHVVSILQDQPVLRDISAKYIKTELLVERLRCRDILHCQADRKCAEFHDFLLFLVLSVQPTLDSRMLVEKAMT